MIIVELIDKQIKNVSFLLFVLAPFLFIYFLDENVLILTLFFPFLIIKMYRLIPFENGEEKNRAIQFFFAFVCVILLICFGIWGHMDGNYIKENKNSSVVEFYENANFLNTSVDTLNYIGETSSYLFIYDSKNRASLVFNKGNISNFKIKDITLTPQEKDKLMEDTEGKIEDFFNRLKEKK